MRTCLSRTFALLAPLCVMLLGPTPGQSAAAARPNIVWIIVEDMSPHFACYGETAIETPHVDRLAAEGLKFTSAIVTAPVCSAARSALITGMYQTSIGAHHHRSGRGKLKIHLPAGVRPVPQYFQEAGYQVLNLTLADFVRPDTAVENNPQVGVAKTDYNFEWDASMYARRHWSRRDSGQPFFAQVQLAGGKHRGHGDGERWPRQVEQTLGSVTQHDAVHLPPYLPRDPVIVEDWAQYLDCVRVTDWEVGRIVERLQSAGELDDTYLFFVTDHGISHVRNKQFLYEGGVHIPLIIRGPGIAAGSVRSDPVEHIDLAATSLALAGIAIPDGVQARDVLAADYQPRDFVFSARDRCDETEERLRGVRSERYKYIRNFEPLRPWLQPNRYKDAKPIVQAMRRLFEQGQLDAHQARILAASRPPEELYDLERDPHELNNLAGDPAAQDVLALMRRELDEWIVRTGDRGETPEPEAMYDSDMEAYFGTQNRQQSEQAEILRRNIEWMKQFRQRASR